MSHGPIIQPRLVGQATTSPGCTSWWKCPSIEALIGSIWDQGIALGSPVVPDEKSTFVNAVASLTTGSTESPAPSMPSQDTSPSRSGRPAPVSTTIAFPTPAFATFVYIGCSASPHLVTSCVMASEASEMRILVAISSGEKLSAMETTTAPAHTQAR